jgi:hypothetical protein
MLAFLQLLGKEEQRGSLLSGEPHWSVGLVIYRGRLQGALPSGQLGPPAGVSSPKKPSFSTASKSLDSIPLLIERHIEL